MRYFDHDTHASDDDLILALRIAHGGGAVDCYWAILEQIYRDERPTTIAGNRPETQALCARLAVAYETLEKYVSTMISYGLLIGDELPDGGYENVTSERAQSNIENYRKLSEKNRLNGQKGGRKPKRKPTQKPSGNPVETQSQPSGCKKRKEKKGLGIDITIPNPTDAGTEFAEGSVPRCPLCKSTLKMVTGRGWVCDCCGEVKPVFEAAS